MIKDLNKSITIFLDRISIISNKQKLAYQNS